MSDKELAEDFWKRAIEALAMAEVGLKVSPDGATNRAYYAAFNAVSALFALEGEFYKKHSALESDVHHKLVKTGKWNPELGEKYKSLHKLRAVGDYGELQHVSPEEAEKAVASATEILKAISASKPDIFLFEK
ncbi:MAG: HEPN domain-containing protein [bacterium]